MKFLKILAAAAITVTPLLAYTKGQGVTLKGADIEKMSKAGEFSFFNMGKKYALVGPESNKYAPVLSGAVWDLYKGKELYLWPEGDHWRTFISIGPTVGADGKTVVDGLTGVVDFTMVEVDTKGETKADGAGVRGRR